MFTRDDVLHDERIGDPIRVTVTDIDDAPKSPRDLELTVTDPNGSSFLVVLWETHTIEEEWSEGNVYELDGARGKRYSTSSGTRVELHSTAGFSVREVEQAKSTRLLVMGDTHVGYRHRTPSEKPVRAQTVNALEVFTNCLERARDSNIDAIVHAGDVFDHDNTQEDRYRVRYAIDRTVNSGVPFYYIFGNHDNEEGRQLLRATNGAHLPESEQTVGDRPVTLLGVDHTSGDFPDSPPAASINTVLNRTVAIIHERPYPVVDGSESLVYKMKVDSADLSSFVHSAEYDIDLVISGHLHVAKQGQIRGCDVPILVSGPTIPISGYKKDNTPSTWLLTITDNDISVERQPL